VPTISQRRAFDGADERVKRLGLGPLFDQLVAVLTGFRLHVAETRDANSAAAVRSMLDERFEEVGGWTKSQAGDVDWVKCHTVNGVRVCLGVEIQMSARSDLLIVDVVHLRDQINAGKIDVGILVTPSDALSVFLTDRVASFSAALTAVERARAQDDTPLVILGLSHDGAGVPLAKRRTRQGRGPAAGEPAPKKSRRKKRDD
jgi:hypothetical protein